MNTDAENAESTETDRPRAAQGGPDSVGASAVASTVSTPDPAALKIQLDILLGVAREEFAEKKYPETLRTCDLILQLDPDNFLALRYAALVHTRGGDIDRAEVYWRRLCVTARAREKIVPALHVARFAQAREQWDTQAEFADLALREDPESQDGLRLATRARVQAKQFDELPDLLPRLYLKEPDRALGFLRLLGGPEQLAILVAVFVGIAKTGASDDALSAFKEECRKAWLVGARRATARREDSLTGRYLRAVLAIEPASQEAIDGLAVLSREGLINLRKAIKKSDRPAAIYHAQTAVEINPALLEAWFDLARLTEDDDPERAAEYFRTCARLHPRHAYHLARAGRSLAKANRLDEALSAYEQARGVSTADSDPQYAEMVPAIAELRSRVFERARELSDEGRMEEAWGHFGAATAGSVDGGVTSAPAKAFLRTMAASLRRGFKEDEPAMIAHAERFLALEPDNKEILSLLGTALMRERQFERAKEVLLRLTQISPDGLGGYVRLARCYHALGHREDGVEAASAALRLDSTSAMTLEVAALFGLAAAAPADGGDGPKP